MGLQWWDLAAGLGAAERFSQLLTDRTTSACSLHELRAAATLRTAPTISQR